MCTDAPASRIGPPEAKWPVQGEHDDAGAAFEPGCEQSRRRRPKETPANSRFDAEEGPQAQTHDDEQLIPTALQRGIAFGVIVLPFLEGLPGHLERSSHIQRGAGKEKRKRGTSLFLHRKQPRNGRCLEEDRLIALGCRDLKLSLRLRRQSGLQFTSSPPAPGTEAGGASNAKPAMPSQQCQASAVAGNRARPLYCSVEQTHQRTKEPKTQHGVVEQLSESCVVASRIAP
ncbi:hypothetical protein AV530_019124 [Patagioenas fasciata monilis]|uniref:Uncharacterized protein n=1 Tax=Patagioenas fasciata monilis TaxID=372326 RepID=A0A1V4KWY5_PATFA|nr:hypothetical protein AV530_019124 [Patagioenas fasciata monilis]